MLHIRNTLHKKIYISRKRYTFKTSNLHHRVLQVTIHLEHLPLRHRTAVNILNRGVPKIALSSSFFGHQSGKLSATSTSCSTFLHQSVALLTRQCGDTLVLSNFRVNRQK